MSLTSGASHPLASAYLDELTSALAGTDPRERAETLDAVREHIADFLAERDDPSDEDVREVLSQLGSVDQVAASAQGAAPDPARQTRRPLYVPGLLTASVISLLLVVLMPWLGVPVALACLVVSAIELRGSRKHDPLLRATVVVSSFSLLAVLVMSLTLLGTSGAGTPLPAQTAASTIG